MAVVVETTVGDFTIDLFTDERPRTCLNFLKLCKRKYYNLNLLYSVERNFVAQTGDPTGTGRGGDSIFKEMFGEQARLYEGEKLPLLRHTSLGTVSMVAYGDNMYGSQFFVTLGEDLHSLDSEHLVFGQVTEGLDVVAKLNDVLTDDKNRPYQDIRITHTVVLDDPYPDPDELEFPDASPEPTAEMLASEYIAAHEDIEDTAGKDMKEIEEEIAQKEAQARATILEMVGDLPDADMAPPENVLFVCKLNPITTSEDLEIIFSRFGKIVCTEVIRDHVSGKSLQYAFIEFQEKKSCEDAYFKMDNVLIDDRRIHVDFSQSVSKLKWRGKGRGVMHFDDRGQRIEGRSEAVPPNRRNKDGDQDKPKSRFIDTSAYQKKYQEEQGNKRRNDYRHRNSERGGKDGYMHGKEGNFARPGERESRHIDDRSSRHGNDGNDRHQDFRNDRYRDDGGNKYRGDRNNRHSTDRNERDWNDRGNHQPTDRNERDWNDRGNRHQTDRSDRDWNDRGNRHQTNRNERDRNDRSNSHRDRRDDDEHPRDHLEVEHRHGGDEGMRIPQHNEEQRRHVTSKRHSSSSDCDSDEEKRKRRQLMGQLRSDLKNNKPPIAKKGKSKRDHLSNDGVGNSPPDGSKKAKKKRKKSKNKKAKYSSSESSDSDSDEAPVKKGKKKSKKKKKSPPSSSSSSTSDSEKESSKKKKKKKRH